MKNMVKLYFLILVKHQIMYIYYYSFLLNNILQFGIKNKGIIALCHTFLYEFDKNNMYVKRMERIKDLFEVIFI